MSQIVIGIAGKKEAGKDTAAKVLIEDYGFRRAAFADSLKEMCAFAFGLSLYDLHDPIKKETKFAAAYKADEAAKLILVDLVKKAYFKAYKAQLTPEQETAIFSKFDGITFDTPRQLLQFVGTNVVREIVADDFWVRLFHRQISEWGKVVITDMRFPNERKFVREVLNGKLVLICRDNENKKEVHSSETSLGAAEEYDKVIQNIKSIKELQEAVEEFYICDVRGFGYKPKPSKLDKLLEFFGAK